MVTTGINSCKVEVLRGIVVIGINLMAIFQNSLELLGLAGEVSIFYQQI